jgi:hypothetical protein
MQLFSSKFGYIRRYTRRERLRMNTPEDYEKYWLLLAWDNAALKIALREI